MRSGPPTSLHPLPGDGSFLFCTVGAQICALPLALVIETMRPQPCFPMRGAPACVLGVAIIRDNPLPVLDLAALLGVQAPAPGRLITIRVGERQIACAVTAVAGIRRIAQARLAGLPPLLSAADAAAVAAVGASDHELLIVLDAARLASPELVGGEA
jgi:purine-binding chemotaxis protein CheW